MHKRHPELFLLDILLSIDSISRNTHHIPFDQFISDEKIFKTTIQDLTVIGEAAKYLLEAPDFLQGSTTEWRKIVDFRNIVIHEYFGIDYDHVYWIITTKIPQLEQDILNLIAKKQNKDLFILAVHKMTEEFNKLHRTQSIEYLKNLEKIITQD